MRKHHAYARHAAAGGLPMVLTSPPPAAGPRSPRAWHPGGGGRAWRGWRPSDALLAAGALWALAATALLARQGVLGGGGGLELPEYAQAPLLISYAYYEKDPIQVSNFEFFLAAGTSFPPAHTDVHWAVVVSGDNCAPCQGLYSILKERDPNDLTQWGIREAWADPKFTLLLRGANVGMDLGAHNATLEFFSFHRRLGHYKYFLLLNSSVKGPFYPAWVPPGWHWSHAFLSRLGGDVHAVGAALVCLPAADAGGPGPRLESWAVALDQEGLAAALEAGVFVTRTCKLCGDGGDGIVVGGEYGLTASQLDAGFNVATLMSRYARGTDWRDRSHWGCNDNVHPSRVGTYDGIAFHPYETVFVKSSWHVADPYTRRYSHWALQHLLGKAGTEGEFNEALYRYAVSPAAQQPRDLEAAYRPVLSRR